jgi:hypothetical protein
MLLVTAMGKIESRDIHPCLDELADDLPRTAGGPDGGDNFRTAHAPIKHLCGKNSSRNGVFRSVRR